MKDDKEVLSFDPFEEDDFMLNKVSPKQEYSIDTFNEETDAINKVLAIMYTDKD